MVIVSVQLIRNSVCVLPYRLCTKHLSSSVILWRGTKRGYAVDYTVTVGLCKL